MSDNEQLKATDNVDGWRPPLIKPFWALALVFLSALVAASWSAISEALKDKVSPALSDLIFTNTLPVWVMLLLLAVAILLFIAIGIVAINFVEHRRISEGRAKIGALNERLEKARKDLELESVLLKKKTAEFENLEIRARDTEQQRLIDPVIGIPNFEMWKRDLAHWTNEINKGNKYSLVLIDIDRFKWINERNPDGVYADEVLRRFAQGTHTSMRRNENMYKVPEKLPDVMEKSQEMYRHHQGGDEFFFILKGDVYSAIGFVNKLAESMRTYKESIREKVLAKFLSQQEIESFDLTFSCALIPLQANCTAEMTIRDAYLLLHRAKKSPTSRMCVVFKDHYEDLALHLGEREKELVDVRQMIGAMAQDAAGKLEAEGRERSLSLNVTILRNSLNLFKPVDYSRP